MLIFLTVFKPLFIQNVYFYLLLTDLAKPYNKGMERFEFVNPNPKKKSVGDCVIRALCIALNKPWEDIYLDICVQGFKMADMPSANHVWGRYLRDKGFKRITADPDITVRSFCEVHDQGTFILGCDSHVVAAVDGCYCDAWDSGDEIVNYYWALSE